MNEAEQVKITEAEVAAYLAAQLQPLQARGMTGLWATYMVSANGTRCAMVAANGSDFYSLDGKGESFPEAIASLERRMANSRREAELRAELRKLEAAA